MPFCGYTGPMLGNLGSKLAFGGFYVGSMEVSGGKITSLFG